MTHSVVIDYVTLKFIQVTSHSHDTVLGPHCCDHTQKQHYQEQGTIISRVLVKIFYFDFFLSSMPKRSSTELHSAVTCF